MGRKMLTAVVGAVLFGMSLIVSALPPPSRIVSPKPDRKGPPGPPPDVRPVPPPPAPVWLTSFESAKAAARAERKVILVNFTGSDWCPWCVRLHDEVFSRRAFLDYASRHLILLTVDFPRKKWMTPAQKRENNALAQSYKIEGFPTILLLDPDGRVIAQTGYRKGGAAAYVDHLRALLRR